MSSNWIFERKEWESNFFGLEIYKLSHCGETHNFIDLATTIEKERFDILEFNLDIRDINFAYHLEKLGFLLVDSRITFITKIQKKDLTDEFKQDRDIQIRMFESDDLESLDKLTKQFLTGKNNFRTRYNNMHFFKNSKKSAEDYLLKWISNSTLDSNALISVALNKGSEIIGYFIYKENGFFESLPLYKGILCSVAKEYQGRKLHLSLQSYLFENIPNDEFFVDNTTQLSNLSIVKNHIRSSRKLDSSFLTFMLKKEELKNKLI